MNFFRKRREKKRKMKEQIELEQIIMTLYLEFTVSQKYIDAQTGKNYYKGQNEILNRFLYKSVNGQKIPQPDLPNNTLNHNFAKPLVDQKVNYCLGKPPKYTCKDEKYLQWFENWIDENNFNYWLNYLATETSNTGLAWLQVYIDEAGELKFMVLPFNQVIPIWEDSLHTKLKAVIKVYETVTDNIMVPEMQTHLEYWTKEGMQSYKVDGNNLFLDTNSFDWLQEVQGDFSGFQPHYLNGDKTPGYWNRIPFIPIKNNLMEQPDIIPLKNLIDNYDLTRSDLSNELAELRNYLIAVANAGGTDIEDFIHNLKLYGVAFVDSVSGETNGSNIGVLSNPMDCTASTTHSNLLKENIIELGQGVNLNLEMSIPPSGVSLKLLYQGLEIKCHGLEQQFNLAFKQLEYFIKTYLEMKNMKPTAPLKMEFQLNSIVNDQEQADTLNKQMDAYRKAKGVISDKTLYENHPWVEDAEEELKRNQSQEDDYFHKGDLRHAL